jgi:hypothetical protein
MRIRYVRAGQICVAAALCWAGVAGPSPVAAADAPDVDEILDQIGTSQNEANERHADYVRELETVEASINNCREFFDQHGDDPEVRAIIRRIREQPGDIFFLTDSTDIEALVEAVGGDISLSQQDLESACGCGMKGWVIRTSSGCGMKGWVIRTSKSRRASRT